MVKIFSEYPLLDPLISSFCTKASRLRLENRTSKIGAIVKDGLNAKLAYEEILKNVLKHHPESKFNKKHLSWYKNRLGVNKT